MNLVNDEQSRAYFLGKLPETEAENFEISCASDAEMEAAAQLSERELIDDYLRGNLTEADAALFETNYLITEARARRLAIAESLWRVADERRAKGAAGAVAGGSFWQSIFNRRYRFQLVFSGLALLLLGFGLVFFVFFYSVDRNDVAEVRDKTEPVKIERPGVVRSEADQNPAQTGPAANSAVPVRDSNRAAANVQPKIPTEVKPVSTPKSAGANPPATADFRLAPGMLRDEGEQFINILPNLKNVKLQLTLPKDAAKYEVYRIVLKTADGDEVLAVPATRTLELTIAADKLENRTYLILLDGQNARSDFESVSEYSFRVRR
ncbi:MAG: hypothetical protein JSS81_06415 [Acidobacteria bacterium]|nr:hypothetical protein [Acidobacteriota bacterium]